MGSPDSPTSPLFRPHQQSVVGARIVAAMCAMLAVVATAVDQWMSHWPDFRLSLLLDVPASRPIAGYIRQLDPSFTFSVPGESYDGVYYWAMAVDPLARGTAHNLIDLSGYRYGHPFLGWMASLLSLGNAQWLPEVFWFLSLATMAAAAWFASRLANQMGGSPWIGLVVAASPGLLFSATSALTEPLQVALVLAALLVWMRHRLSRPVLLAAILVATCLTKEQLVLLPCALALEFGIDWLRHRGRLDWRALPVLAVGPLALLAWRAYLRTVMTAEQMDYPEANNIGAPVQPVATAARLRHDAAQSGRPRSPDRWHRTDTDRRHRCRAGAGCRRRSRPSGRARVPGDLPHRPDDVSGVAHADVPPRVAAHPVRRADTGLGQPPRGDGQGLVERRVRAWSRAADHVGHGDDQRNPRQRQHQGDHTQPRPACPPRGDGAGGAAAQQHGEPGPRLAR